jgi:hypothetical protein
MPSHALRSAAVAAATTAIASLLAGLFPEGARAASVTEVLDAADADDPFDLWVQPYFRYVRRQSRINRERCVDANRYPCSAPLSPAVGPVPPYYNKDVKELDHVQTSAQLLIEARVGLYKDVEFHFTIPAYEFGDRHTISLASGVVGTAGNNASSLVEDGIFTNEQIGDGAEQNSKHTGFGDATLGLAWAPLNNERNWSVATWKLGFDVTVPTGRLRRPDLGTGGVGRKVIELAFTTALSKRIGMLDPYVGFGYYLPIALGTAYDNQRCDPDNTTLKTDLDAALAGGDLVACQPGPHTLKESSLQPGQRASMFLGMEVVPWEEPSKHQRFAIDMRIFGVYHARGRDYTEISDFLNVNADGADAQSGRSPFVPVSTHGELTRHDQYATIGGLFGLYVHLARYVRFFANVELSHTSEHLLTNEGVGRDLDGDSQVDPYIITGNDLPPENPESCPPSGALVVNCNATARQEQNNDYNQIVDQPGRRLKLQRTFNLAVTVGGGVTF